MKCKHEEIFVKLEIVRWIEGSTNGVVADVRLNRPVQVKATVTCPECGFDSVYNAYGAEWIEAKGYGAQNGPGWPIWLKRHMRVLAGTSPIITEALRACGVLARDEEV
jgi:hypothetical protein